MVPEGLKQVIECTSQEIVHIMSVTTHTLVGQNSSDKSAQPHGSQKCTATLCLRGGILISAD